MRKLVGILIITVSILLGLCCAILFQEDLIIANIILWVISIPLYIIGHIIRTSKAEFRYRGKRWVSIYIYFFFILPLLIHLFVYFNDFKESKIVDEQYIIYEPASGKLGDLSIGVFVILIFLFAGRFLNPGLKRKKLLNIIIIGTVIFLIGFNYLMFSDYRGVHETKGLISSNWKGERDIISYEEIESVYLEPYVHYAKLSNRSDETRFVWKVTFLPMNEHNEVVYYFPMMSESNLEQTIEIKKIAMENNIPFNIDDMSPKTLEWFEFDLKLEGLDNKRYYELFQVNNIE